MIKRATFALASLIVPLVSSPILGAAGPGDGDRLLQAVKAQNHPAARRLLEQRADVNATQGDGATALHWAAYWDDADTAGLLVRAGANVNAVNDLGITPLYLACANGNTVIVANLLKAGADPNVSSASGVSPLMAAARTGALETVKLLLARGVDVNAREMSRGQTALMWAAGQRHPDVVRALLENGADVTIRTKVRTAVVNRGGPNGTIADEPYVGEVERGGSTPLLFAVRQGDLESARLMLAAGADVNEQAPDGYSVLLMAAHSGHGALASYLLDHGADPNAAAAGFTTLHAAVLIGDADLVKALLAHGADANARITRATPIRRLGEDLALPEPLVGATPFFLAAKYADLPLMRLLAAAGADPRMPTTNGTTALMAAAGVGWSATTSRRGIDVTANKAAAPDPHEAESETLAAVQLAIALGSDDVNASNVAHETALWGAVSRGFAPVAKLLVEKGARLDVKNRRGQTLLALTAPRTQTSATPQAMLDATAAVLRELGARD